jgi:putative flavoprotein involved in K+ transport
MGEITQSARPENWGILPKLRRALLGTLAARRIVMSTRTEQTAARVEPFVESGEAFRRLGGVESVARRDRYDVVVIGGGQAGLSVGYYLRKRGLRFVILDASARVGDVWRKRWDSLRLFTPAKFDGLDGMKFPAPPNHFPTKDQMADYLEAYAARFQLPVRTGARVDRLYRRDGVFVVRAGATEVEANQVVVAMANYQSQRTPAFARDLRSDIAQVASCDYRNPDQLRDGDVLIVGAGNSGAEIAKELVRDHRVFVAGPSTGEAPFKVDSVAGRAILMRLLMRVMFHRVLTVKTPMGRKARPRIMKRGTPLIRVKSQDLAALGIERVPRMTGASQGLPLLEDGRVLNVANVVWCSGFAPGFSWIDRDDLPVLGDDGEPIHEGGVVPSAPGLYFVGLHFLYAMSSSMIHGVGRDAKRIAGAVAARSRSYELRSIAR